MSIDWFTFAAQLVNLLLLIWLLKRFLYGPILAAIAAREKRITEELAQAKARQAEADQQRDEFRYKVDEVDQRKAALLTEATQKAQAEYQRLLEALGNEPASVDALVGRCGLTAETVSSMLLILELQGFVAAAPGGLYSRLSP